MPYIDKYEDLKERVQSCIHDGMTLEEAIEQAIDDGLIYYDDILAIAHHYGVIDYDKLVDDCYDDLYSDLANESYDGLDKDEEE